MKARKTITVEWLKEVCNTRLGNLHLSQGEKKAIVCLIEDVLFMTNNYKGFQWRYWISGGSVEWEQAGKPDNRDPYIYGGAKRDHEWDRIYL